MATPNADQLIQRRLPIGAECLPSGGVHFRVWAPRCKNVRVVFQLNQSLELSAESDGYFSGIAPTARPGDLYRFGLDDRKHLFPDPASRFQPQGPHGRSQIVDHRAFEWRACHWKGITREGQVLQEIHIGTFTPEGTWQAAADRLPLLAEVGITCLEIMPIADFPGQFGWGYDGVDLFAPTRLYGSPDDFRRFIDRAHELRLGVILDVVYNHLGPDGNHLKEFSADYFSGKHKTDWGEALNFDGDSSGPVREFFLANARYWIEEFRLDGFRFDATQNIYDDSSDHILAAIVRTARKAAGERSIYLISENEPQNTRLIRATGEGGFGLDALWNDDFHHSAMVALTGHAEAYFSDYIGSPQELVSTAKWGFIYQGQHSTWQKGRRGTPTFDLPATAFVNFIENHDQLANFAQGNRSHWTAASGRHKALTALLLLCPQTPMLFQGQEFGATSPFMYFADHHPELAKLVGKGRREFLCQFPSATTPEMEPFIPDPSDRKTFEHCKLDWSQRQLHPRVLKLHRDLLALRRNDPVFSRKISRGLDGCVLGAEAFALRFFANDGGDRLLVVNLGRDLVRQPAPEPLLAPLPGMKWKTLWSSEDPCYGGHGTVPLETGLGFRIPAHAAVVLVPTPKET